MRRIERSSTFKRDFKKIQATPRHRNDIEELPAIIVRQLLTDKPLPESNRDHSLTGKWASYRECHIKPDLLLIYANLMPISCVSLALDRIVNCFANKGHLLY